MIKKLIAAGLFPVLVLTGVPLAAQQADTQPAPASSPAASDQLGDIPNPTSFAEQPPEAPKPKAIGPQAYGPAPPPKKCTSTDPRRPGEIVVCGAKDDKEFRVKSSAELDPNSKEALDDGRPHAPDFAESCKKNPKGACFSIGGAPAPVYMIKFDELPDTPAGSDADKIAKGEKKGGE